jgi:hypothetical protein
MRGEDFLSPFPQVQGVRGFDQVVCEGDGVVVAGQLEGGGGAVGADTEPEDQADDTSDNRGGEDEDGDHQSQLPLEEPESDELDDEPLDDDVSHDEGLEVSLVDP